MILLLMVKLRWNMIENVKDCYRDLEKKVLFLILIIVSLIYQRLILWVIYCLFVRGICFDKFKIEVIIKVR